MNFLLEKYGKEKRWVQWRLETVKGKETKIPYMPNGKHASSTDPKTWGTYAQVKGEKEGIVLFDKQLLCIDIDHVLEDGKLNHDEKETIATLILDADTYTEVSQSGTGLHLFLALTTPLVLSKNKKAPYEAYTSGRYICVTGNDYGEPRPVRTVTPETALALIETIIPQEPASKAVSDDFLPEEAEVAPTHTFSDQDLLDKMFSSKNGESIEKLYNGSLAAHKNDASTGDMALCSHLAFYSGRNAEQIERIWRGSPLGAREKVQEREDYRKRTVTNAIALCKEVYTPPVPVEIDLLYVMKDDKKVYIQNTENICRVLRQHAEFKGILRYDEFNNIFEILDRGKWRVQEDHDGVDIQTRISVLFKPFMKVGKDMIWDAIMKVSKENTVDTAIEYLKNLSWDKEKRLDQWLMHTYGVEDNEYHRKVGSNWLKGLVKRIIQPGCQFDYVLVLEGEQGAKKSTSLAVLGGKWHTETTMSTDSKDFFMQFSGKAIVEFSEGETLSRTEVKRMKAIITMRFDRYRMPYARSTNDYPRRCVFAMTTNQTEYLKDETGNRRWLPITVVLPEANIAWLEEWREQLLAEAYHRVVVVKETIYEFPKEDMLREQGARMIHDANEEMVTDWYFNELPIAVRESGITIHQVYNECYNKGFAPKQLDKMTEMQISGILKNSLHLDKKRAMQNNVRIMRWYPQVMSTPSEYAEAEKQEQERIF